MLCYPCQKNKSWQLVQFRTSDRRLSNWSFYNIQVVLCQIYLFFYQLSQNITTDFPRVHNNLRYGVLGGWVPYIAFEKNFHLLLLSSHFVLLSNWVFAVWVGTSKHIQSPAMLKLPCSACESRDTTELRTESILTVPATAKHRAVEKLNHGSHHYVRSSSMFYVHSFMWTCTNWSKVNIAR